MAPEVDFRGGIRGKYLARYQRWAGITTATGSVTLNAMSTGGSDKKIVGALVGHPFLIAPRNKPNTIAPEVSSAASR